MRMFRRISYRIALQFTAFVFGLLMLTGALFLAADVSNAHRMSQGRLARSAQQIVRQSEQAFGGQTILLPAPMVGRVRIVTNRGDTVFEGELFRNVPMPGGEGFSSISSEGEDFTVFTTAIYRNGELIGFVQVADIERLQFRELPRRYFIYFIVSIAISLITYVVGLYFARNSLKTAESMMERLEQFTQDASHELKTPLAALNSSLDLALRTKNYHDGITSAKEDVKQLATLVERLLELTRLDTFALNKTDVDLSGLAEQIAHRNKSFASERSVNIETDIAPGIHVDGDALLISQVMTNLLVNAIKFSKPAGGTVRLKLRKNMLSVADDGIGINAADVPHLFDRFFQSDPSRSRGGLGLGLALVKRIIDLHGWTIAVESREEKGTEFSIRFA